jgi:hypothetical protein
MMTVLLHFHFLMELKFLVTFAALTLMTSLDVTHSELDMVFGTL